MTESSNDSGGPDTTGQVIARVDSLTKKYSTVTALRDLTLEIPHGVVGLVGPNGAGKSTFMKILLGLIQPSSGRAEVFGIDAATGGRRIRERVGYKPEHDCLPTDLSATQFVIHMARMSGVPATVARERAAETLRHVGLFEERYRHMGGYSTGMKQRVKLAQALVHDPRLLFLDEPTNGLDPGGRDEMLSLVQRTGTDFGISVIMSSHLLGEIESVCDSLILIEDGELDRAGSISGFTGLGNVLTVEVGQGSDDLVERLTAQGIDSYVTGDIVEIEIPEASVRSEASLTRLVVDCVVELKLPLIRVARQRHTLQDIFRSSSGNSDGHVDDEER